MASEDVKVPDIGDFTDVEIVEVLVAEGDSVHFDDPLITLETDKASMEVPSPMSGTVKQLKVKVGDRVSEGSSILVLEGAEDGDGPKHAAEEPEAHDTAEASKAEEPAKASSASGDDAPRPATVDSGLPPPAGIDFGNVNASPSVRRLARELDVDLTKVKGSGDKGRITKDDVKAHLSGGGGAPAAAATGGAGIPEVPVPDFTQFGEVETVALPRIKKISGPHLHRAWLNVPAVTHADEADITETDGYRKELDTAAKEKGYRVTLLSFLMKASVSALRQFPTVNSSLNAEKDSLILKKYVHIGIAVDTPDGLVVPVIRDVDRKGVDQISKELGEVSQRARDGKLSAADMQGASFTISSLGGIGGTHFSPIVNAPEVAILGVVRSKISPVWDGKAFKPRNMLPVCLSYDHRVIDGALAARFTRHLCHVLEDVRRLVL